MECNWSCLSCQKEIVLSNFHGINQLVDVTTHPFQSWMLSWWGTAGLPVLGKYGVSWDWDLLKNGFLYFSDSQLLNNVFPKKLQVLKVLYKSKSQSQKKIKM